MMPLCKAIAKQLLGARYEGAVRALAAAGVLYLAVRASGWQVTVAPAVRCLSTAWYTAGVLLQQLQGCRLQDTVAALLAMPCRQRLAPVYTLTVGGCTLLTRTLPGQAARFGRGYCLFLFGVNTLVAGLYLAGWLLAGGQPGAAVLVPVFALQSAILSVGLEWLRPLRGWKTESELWHHPRKYLVPLVMLLLGAGVSAWPPLSALLAAALAVQCAALLWLTGRQKN